MLISPKLAEYVITGAFFWVGQILVVCLASLLLRSSLLWSSLVKPISYLVANTPTPIHQPLIALATVLSIVTVVFTGLVIEVSRGIFLKYDMVIFSRYVRQNDQWLSRLVSGHKEACGDDYSDLRDKLVYTRILKQSPHGNQINRMLLNMLDNELLDAVARVLLFFHPSLFGIKNHRRYGLFYRSLARSRKQGKWLKKLNASYRRIHSFILAYIVTHPLVGELGALDERLQLSKTMRSLTMAAWLLLYESIGLSLLILLLEGTIKLGIGIAFVGSLCFLLVDLITKLLSTQAYERYCDLLFQLAYIASTSDEKAAERIA